MSPPTAPMPLTALDSTEFWATVCIALTVMFGLMLLTIVLYFAQAPIRLVGNVYWVAMLVPLSVVGVLGWNINTAMTHNENVVEARYGVQVNDKQSSCLVMMAEMRKSQCEIDGLSFVTREYGSVTAYDDMGYAVTPMSR